MTAARRVDRAWIGDRLALPLAAFAAAEVVVLLAGLGAGHEVLRPDVWALWDAKHYLAIAEHGYDLHPCGPTHPGLWCGNAAWFPGYSWMARALSVVGISVSASGLILARLLALGTLVVVWNGLLDRDRSSRALAALAFAAFCPGSLFFHAQFPMSAATFFVVSTIVFVRRERWWLAAVCAGIGATTYAVVILLTPVIVLWLLFDHGNTTSDPPLRERVRRSAIVASGTAVGTAIVLVVMRAHTGKWDAFPLAHEYYAYQTRFPLFPWLDRVEVLLHGSVGREAMIPAQALLVAVVMAILIGWETHQHTRGLPRLVLGLCLVVWLAPLTIGQGSIYRVDSLLVPAAVLVARLPTAVAWGVTFCCAALVGPMTVVWLGGTMA